MRQRKATGFAVALAACAMTFGLCGCSFSLNPTSVEQATQQQESALTPQVKTPTIHKNGQLAVGIATSDAVIPLSFSQGGSGLKGLDIDLAAALADQLGLKVSFIPVSSASEAQTKGCDIVMDVKQGDKADVTVVGHYVENAVALFKKGDQTVVSKDDLAGKTVGIQPSTTAVRILNNTNLVMTQKNFSNLNEAFDALNSGTVDYVVCDALSGAYLANTYNGISFAGTVNVPEAYGIGVASSNTALQQAVQKAFDDISSNGILQLIKQRWLGNMPALTGESQIKGVEVKKAAKPATSSSSTLSTSTNDAGDGSEAGANAVTIN